MAGELKRKLDVATKASIDVVALNNQVVSMRPIVKRSKVFIIHKMVKKIRSLRKKKGTEEQRKQNLSKANNLVKEIQVIKVLRADYISKYALGATEPFKKIICQPNLDMERRALARLAEHEFIQKFVQKFRAEHSDWKELAAYLMTKHTSREFKKKKSKKKLAQVATNVKATEQIVETYLGDKLKSINTDMDIISERNKVQSRKESEQLGDQSSYRPRSLLSEKFQEGSQEASVGDSDDSVSEPDSDEPNHKVQRKIAASENTDIYDSESDFNRDADEESSEHEQEDSAADGTSESESESDSHKFSMSEKDVKSRLAPSQMKRVKKKASDDKLKGSSESLLEKSYGEMIVKKINLEDWAEESIDTGNSNTVPKFLLETAAQKIKRKVKDPFFCTNDDDDSASDNDVSDNDNNSDGNSWNAKDSENADSRFERDSELEPVQFTGIRGLNTTFVDSLKKNRMMKCDDPKYRSNADWKKKRHEMKSERGGFDRTRGRGQFVRGRGGNTRHSRGQSQQMRGRGNSRENKGDLRGRGRGHHSQPARDYGRPPFKQGHDSYRTEEKLLQPSWLKQGSTAASKTSEEQLHPSWLASKKRKEQQTSIQNFQGKKIKFDD